MWMYRLLLSIGQPTELARHSVIENRRDSRDRRPWLIGRILWIGFLSAGFWGSAGGLWTPQSAPGQIISGYSSLPGFSENGSHKRLGDARRFSKAQSRLTHQVRVGDELWVVSTRHLPTHGHCVSPTDRGLAASFAEVETARYCQGHWEPTSADQLLDSINSDLSRQNVLFIHGNRTDLNWAGLRGIETYEALIVDPCCQAPTTHSIGPVRWIIWAWPSDPVHGPRADLALKQQRAVAQGPYLRQFLQSLQVESLGVVAYSLGAQALTSALCHPIVQDTFESPSAGSAGPTAATKLRVVMLAGAVPVNWMQSAEAEACFGYYLDHLTLINNTRDRALEVYRKFTGCLPIGAYGRQLTACVPAETFLLSGNQLDNHFLTHYLEHPQTRAIIRSRLLPAHFQPELDGPIKGSAANRE